MAEKKELIFRHVKAPGFVSVSASATALTANTDGTMQLVFYAQVTDLDEETATLEPLDDKGDLHKISGTTFKTTGFKEDRVRVVMAEQHMRDLAGVLAKKFPEDKDKKSSGNGAKNG